MSSLHNFLETYWTDVYKTGHNGMLPSGHMKMVSNFTPRSGKLCNLPNNGKVVSMGQQKLIRQLHYDWQSNFFSKSKNHIYQFKSDMEKMLNIAEFDISHILSLHDLGYLPIEFISIDEGELIPYGCPLYMLYNTHEVSEAQFDWIVNYVETILSTEVWIMPTSATLSKCLNDLSRHYVAKTDPENMWFCDYANHDFSMRGHNGKSGIINSGLAFAACSRGSDTLPVIPASRIYYDEPYDTVPINSVLASEHAIMCSLTGFFKVNKKGSWEKIGELELETFRYLLEKFPDVILSLVSDTWDLWRVIIEYCDKLKELILSRPGKLVIRPDSGDPVDIICGTDLDFEFNSHTNLYESAPKLGVIRLLDIIFGHDITTTGYKRLNPKVGAIYGDSITYDRELSILTKLETMGYSATNIVFGVGSFSTQYTTRDVHGMAQKATYIEIEINGQLEEIELFKDPVTDSGMKKSHRGLIHVSKDENGEYVVRDQVTWEEFKDPSNLLRLRYSKGTFYNSTTLTAIREKLSSQTLNSTVIEWESKLLAGLHQ